MKKLSTMAMSLLFFSCQITESLYLSETGMVKQETKIDLSGMMSLAYTAEDLDSLKQIGQFPIDEMLPVADAYELQRTDGEEMSTAEKEFAKAFNKSHVRMVQNENEWLFSIVTDEMDVKSFNDYNKNIQKAFTEFEKSNSEEAKKYAESGYANMFELKYDGKSFERKSLNKKAVLDLDNTEVSDSSGLSAKDIMNMAEYSIDYHFAKPVKSTTLKDGEIGADGKTVSSKIQLTDLLEKPEDYNFKVEFK